MVKEFCCGCSLRTGTLILSWSFLVQNCIFSVLTTAEILAIPKDRGTIPWAYFLYYYLVWSFLGIPVCILGIFAIQVNKPKLLNGMFYYLLYHIPYYIVLSILLVISPHPMFEIPRGRQFSRLIIHMDLTEFELFMVYAMGFSFLSAFLVYFALVVKSCREDMLNK